MLIVCSGPDTWSARRKAQELMQSFRAKHDQGGYSTVVLTDPSLAELLPQLGTMSLFAQKRFIRVDRLLEKMKIADVRTLAKRLEADHDQSVILTVEDEPPAQKTLDELKAAPLFQYSFATLHGTKFVDWCVKRGSELGVSPELSKKIAQRLDGDSWLAEQELIKLAANPSAPLVELEGDAGSIFDLADRYLKGNSWRVEATKQEDDNAMPIFLSQARSFLRARDGEVAGMHPFVVKKLGMIRSPDAESRFRSLLRAFAANRQGLAQTDETETLF